MGRRLRDLLLDDGRLPRPPILAFATTRLLIFAAAWASLALAPLDLPPGAWRAFADFPALDGWARWDSGWYRSIALEGYSYSPGQPSNVAFFPLYPWLSLVLSLPLRAGLRPDQAFYIAGLLLSNAAFLLACFGIWRLAKECAGGDTAGWAVWLFAAFPYSFFASAVYTEGLFMALAVWAFVFARTDRWGAAAACASLAAVTRIPGWLVAVALALDWLWSRRWRPWPLDRAAAALALAPLPLLGFLAWLHACFGNALVFVAIQTSAWNKSPGLDPLLNCIRSLSLLSGLEFWLYLSYLVALPVAAVLGFYAWRRLGPGLGFYALASVALYALTGIEGTGRFLSVLFPIFIAAASLLRRASPWVAAACVPALVTLAVLFARWKHLT